MDEEKVSEICRRLEERIETKHIRVFKGDDKPLLLISDTYYGVWLEHVFDSVIYAEMYPEKGRIVAENTVNTFLKLQKENGQLPCYVWDGACSHLPAERNIGWSQMQECVSFGQLVLRALTFLEDEMLPRRCYEALKRWVGWQRAYRMRTGRGLVEMFYGYDTGHDNSGRLSGMCYPQNRILFGKERGAELMPRFDRVAPILATDMNAVFYGNLTALATLAKKLNMPEEERKWLAERAQIKKNLFDLCYDQEDEFFYDVDKMGQKRKYLSCAILAFFQEGVLDPVEDKDVVEKLLKRHILNEKEFWTTYPFPSMAISDPSARHHKKYNDWGYFTQGNTVLRTVLWMDKYRLSAEQDHVCKQWLSAWTDCFDKMPVGQELDPVSGEPSPSSPWYSTGMLFYLWSAKRLGIVR